MAALDKDLASRLASLVLMGVCREYPNLTHHVLDGTDQVLSPKGLHPAFYGCFDWHSAVHSHWTLLRILRAAPDLAEASQIHAVFEQHLTPSNIAVETKYFDHPLRSSFERPYGWAWLLRLAAELATFQEESAQRWAVSLRPLQSRIAALLGQYLQRLVVPNRVGTHGSTAFALTHAHDYAVAVGDHVLRKLIEQRSLEFFGDDIEAPTAYEPSGEDFISPALIEADLMRRVLGPAEFGTWLDVFLPSPSSRQFKPLLEPTPVSDPKDYRIGHLIGLALQRAASFHGIASALPREDSRQQLFSQLAHRHQEAGLSQLFDSGYGGGHWLASFAVFLLTRSGPY